MSITYTSNPRLDVIFDDAKNRKLILIVALDYAESFHTILFTNGFGDQFRATFDVKNNRDVCDFIIDAVRRM